MFSDFNNIRVTDAKEVGVGNPAEETFCHPDAQNIAERGATVKFRDAREDRVRVILDKKRIAPEAGQARLIR